MSITSRRAQTAAALCCALAAACSAVSTEQPAPPLVVSPAAPQVAAAGRITFAATIAGEPVAVRWSVLEGAAGGSIGDAGVYTAPGAPGTFHVVATSVADGKRSGGATVTVTAPAGDLAWQLEALSGRAVWFGHQSVGQDVMDGVQALLDGNPGAEPVVVTTSRPEAMGAGRWAEFAIGENYDPAGKVSAFKAAIDGGVGARVDVAFFKFCWVDFDAGSAWFQGGGTAAGLFAVYRAAMASLRAAHPGVTFVHLTTPLYVDTERNVQRNEFNALVRATYGGAEPVFDLALLESTDPGGAPVIGAFGPALYPGYTSDGGHLSAAGKERLARALIALLAGLP